MTSLLQILATIEEVYVTTDNYVTKIMNEFIVEAQKFYEIASSEILFLSKYMVFYCNNKNFVKSEFKNS